jgi:hypothetical protein
VRIGSGAAAVIPTPFQRGISFTREMRHWPMFRLGRPVKEGEPEDLLD